MFQALLKIDRRVRAPPLHAQPDQGEREEAKTDERQRSYI